MRDALKTLPWVESDTIQADSKTREVAFKVKSGMKFDLQAASEAIKKAGFAEVNLVRDPDAGSR